MGSPARLGKARPQGAKRSHCGDIQVKTRLAAAYRDSRRYSL
jgi:hypothetical protein